MVGLHQRSNESLTTFMDHFSRGISNIKNLNLVVDLHVMLASLKSGQNLDSLARREPIALDEFRHRSVGYINMEKLATAKHDIPLEE